MAVATNLRDPLICPGCEKVITPSNQTARPWGADGPIFHKGCDKEAAETFREMDQARSAYVPFVPPKLDERDEDRHETLPPLPPKAARREYVERRARIREVRTDSGRLAESIDVQQLPTGGVILEQWLPMLNDHCSIVLSTEDVDALQRWLNAGRP